MEKVKFIGRVHSALKKLEDCALQESEDAPEATVEIFQEFLEGAKNFLPGTKVILLTWLHQSDRTILSTHPRNDPNAPLTGVFSTRSPDRPNPIGMHRVTISSVEGNRFHVSALEVLDQTPVIDIKPELKQ